MKPRKITKRDVNGAGTAELRYQEEKKKNIYFFFFFRHKTAYEIKECDWSSDVCSSDLAVLAAMAERIIT